MKMEEKLISNRRQFLIPAALGQVSCGLNGKTLIAATPNKSGLTILDKNSCIDIGNRNEAIIQKAYGLCYLYEDKYKGCACCTVAALQDAIETVYNI